MNVSETAGYEQGSGSDSGELGLNHASTVAEKLDVADALRASPLPQVIEFRRFTEPPLQDFPSFSAACCDALPFNGTSRRRVTREAMRRVFAGQVEIR